MGGYGASSGRVKGKCYQDSGGHKVTDPNAIAVGEYYIKNGHYVVFLQEKKDQKRADLSVDGIHTEVKGLDTMSTSKVRDRIRQAFEQTEADNYRYPPETHRDGRVVILSKYPDLKTAYNIVSAGYRKARKDGFVHGDVFLYHGGKMYLIGGR